MKTESDNPIAKAITGDKKLMNRLAWQVAWLVIALDDEPMKTELIEYHRAEADYLDAEAAVSDEAAETRAFHYRAIAWLEGPPHPELPAVWDGARWVSPEGVVK